METFKQMMDICKAVNDQGKDGVLISKEGFDKMYDLCIKDYKEVQKLAHSKGVLVGGLAVFVLCNSGKIAKMLVDRTRKIEESKEEE